MPFWRYGFLPPPRTSPRVLVAWVPWRRPGFQLGLDISGVKAANPRAIGCILGGHGITAWGDTSDEAEANSRWIIETAQTYIDVNGKAEPFGGVRSGFKALPEAERLTKAAALAPTIRGLASTDKPMVGHFTGSGPTESELAHGAEAHRRMAERAAANGLYLSLEHLNRFETYFLNTMEQARAYVARVDHPAFRIMYDTFHANIEEQDQPRAIRTIAGSIGVLHVSENDRGIPGRGHIDFASIFRAVRTTT